MPHSGGGGSHSGGSHGGGHGGSHGGSHSSGPRISNTYFEGANRYVYYHNRSPHYYYAKSVYKPDKTAPIVLIAMGLIWLVVSVISAAAFLQVSSGKLPLDYADTSIEIEDEIGIVEDADHLKEYLRSFQEKSGVTVGVVTRSFENAYIGTDCENQSYNCYVSRWEDESHWLIYYVGEGKDRSGEWEWNLMCGDDCLKVLTAADENKFTENFHRYLASGERYTFDECVIKALDQIDVNTGLRLTMRSGVTENGVDVGGQPASIALLLMIGIFFFVGILMFVIGIRQMMKKPSEENLAKTKAVQIPLGTVQECTCSYCGGIYIRGTVISCPHCGAPLSSYEMEGNS